MAIDEAKLDAAIQDHGSRLSALESKKFLTADDLEARLAQSHSTSAGTAVAAKLCPVCGSSAHEKC